MAYNNFFPANYQPMVYQPQPQMQMQPQQQMAMPQTQPQMAVQQPQQNNSMIWVQGETGAKSYLLAPNTTLPLWDSENQIIYLKSTDASGMPSMKILDYTIRDNSQPQMPISEVQPQAQALPQQPTSDFVTHEELDKFEENIRSKIDEIMERRKHEPRKSNANADANKK